jgi:hypothetical protein
MSGAGDFVAVATLDGTATIVVVVVMLLMVLHHIVGAGVKVAANWLEHRSGNGIQGTVKENTLALHEVRAALQVIQLKEPPPYPQCHYAPDHFDQVEETHRLVVEIREMQEQQKIDIAAGRFHCALTPAHVRTLERVDEQLRGGRNG